MVMMLIHDRPTPTILHPITENQWSIRSERDPLLALVLPVVIHEYDVKRMEVTWDEATSASINIIISPLRERKDIAVEETYPRKVSNMLKSTSAPQPATKKTPRGGTKFILLALRSGEKVRETD